MACALTEEAVARCGEAMLREVLGAGFDGEVFLAGGAFRTLLTGRRPRDLDLWAPDDATRVALTAWLMERGASLERDHPPFQTAFRCGPHTVDVPYAVGTTRLVERLARFDLGLSAIGVTWRRGRVVEAVVDPCALRSVETRAVWLLRPLRNVSYLLNTLERAHRYGRELGFEVPDEEQRLLWTTYASLPHARKEKVLSNYAWADGRDERIIGHARSVISQGCSDPDAAARDGERTTESGTSHDASERDPGHPRNDEVLTG